RLAPNPTLARVLHLLYTACTIANAWYPSSPDTNCFRPVRIASPKSRNWRSNGSIEIAIGSDDPDATSFETGAASPEAFSTSHVVSLSPEIIAVPFVPWNSVRSVYPGQKAVAA